LTTASTTGDWFIGLGREPETTLVEINGTRHKGDDADFRGRYLIHQSITEDEDLPHIGVADLGYDTAAFAHGRQRIGGRYRLLANMISRLPRILGDVVENILERR
jgi:hypothetical protein